MQFEDVDLRKLNPKTRSGLASLLQHLCGEEVNLSCTAGSGSCEQCQTCIYRSVILPRLKVPTLLLEDLNDVLLLVDQFPLGEPFFKFFLSECKRTISFQELKEGIVRFKGYALLRYGNVRFAYRSLYKLATAELSGRLGRFCRETQEL